MESINLLDNTADHPSRNITTINESKDRECDKESDVETGHELEAKQLGRRKIAKQTWKLETEEERRKRLEYARLKNQRYKEKYPQKYMETRKRCNQRWQRERALKETPEQRQLRLQKMRENYLKRKKNMTPEQVEEVRRKDRERWRMVSEGERQKKLKAQRTYRERKMKVEEERRKSFEKCDLAITSEDLELNSLKEKASRATKVAAKKNIRRLMEDDADFSTEEPGGILSNVSPRPKYQKDSEIAKKWGLKPSIVVLERIDLTQRSIRTEDDSVKHNELSGMSIERDEDLTCFVDRSNIERKWNLRRVEVRLERIDAAKIRNEMKIQSHISSVY